jgi:hypothetical protein
MELIHPSSTAKNDSVMALVMAVTSRGECVPIGASRFSAEAAVLTDVLTDETDATGPEDIDAALWERGKREEATEPSATDNRLS